MNTRNHNRCNTVVACFLALLLVIFILSLYGLVFYMVFVDLAEGAELEEPSAAEPTVAVGVGGFTNVTFGGELLPSYQLTTVSVAVPAGGRFTLIPGAGLDVAPVAGNWGIYGFFIIDYALSNRFGIDWYAAAAYDWDPLLRDMRGSAHTGYVGGGVGISLFMDNGMALSPAPLLLCNVEGLGCAFSPGVTLAIPLP